MKALGLTLALLFLPTIALAQQPQCGNHNAAIEHLADKYGEALTIQALMGGNTILELFVNEETGTWTALGTDTNGLTCLIASGEDWSYVTPAPQGQDG